MKQRIILAFVAAMLCVNMTVPALAATGYATGTVEKNDYNPVKAETQITEEKIETAVETAIEKGITTANVKVRNVKTVETETLSKVAEAAQEENKQAAVHFDQIKGNKVTVRITVDPAVAGKLEGNLNVYGSIEKKDIAKADRVFDKYFSNKTEVVYLGQSGSYGMNVKIAAKVDLTDMNIANLRFYVYNAATNTYSKLTTGYYVDANGYLHFTTPVGGSIIISNGPLTAKS